MLPTNSGGASRAEAAHKMGLLSLILMDGTCFHAVQLMLKVTDNKFAHVFSTE